MLDDEPAGSGHNRGVMHLLINSTNPSSAVFKTREVARALSLSPRRVRRMIYAGLLRPTRSRGGEYRFSFQDIVVLRMSKTLQEEGVPRSRIRGCLIRLRRQMPRGRPLTSVRIWTEGDQIFARDGRETWNPESGQILLDFGAPGDRCNVEPLRA
ncbi:MAG: MerR family transcriptional regulator [Acidobacteriota bacterium]